VQNLIYALIQVVHNFGATAIIGLSVYSIWNVSGGAALSRASFTAAAWALQGLSGALFGMVTYYYYGHLPDIHGVAVAALFVKMVCAVLGFALAVFYAKWGFGWSAGKCRFVWVCSFTLGSVALSSAAFLRWFS
jgi:hypothetical protein